MSKLSLSEILQLDISNQSIKKIDAFLADEVEYSDTFMRALAHKALLLHQLGNSNEAINLLSLYIKNLRLLSSFAVISICNSMISITLDLENFEEALKYINLKKSFLPVSKMNLYLKDMISYLLKTDSINEAKETLITYLKDDISKDESLFAKEELANIYYKQGEYDEFINITNGLLEIYQDKLDIDNEAMLQIKLLKIAYKKSNYIKVVSDVNKIINNFDSPKYLLSLATLAIKSYMALNDYKKAGIFESNYEEYISEDYYIESKEFINAAIDLYDIQGSRVSVKELENLLKELETKVLPKPKKKKNKEEEVSIPKLNISGLEIKKEEIISINDLKPNIGLLNPKEDINVAKNSVKQNVVSIKNESVSSFYNKLSGLLDVLNQMNLKNKFREIFRLSMIEISKLFNIDEAYILDASIGFRGMHYKTERVYDKKITPEGIKGTINLASFEGDSEFFLDMSDRDNNINIVTNEPYPEDYYGYAIPLHNDNDIIGSIAYFSKNPFLAEEMVYEGLKMVSAIINSRLLLSMEKEKMNLNNQKLYFLKDNMSLGIKEEMEGYIHLSPYGAKMLGVFEDLLLEDYYNHIPTNYLIEYKNIRNSLYTNVKEATYEYDFKKENEIIRIKESFYSLLYEGSITIISVLDDITSYQEEKQQLINLAYTNPISKLDTEVKLMVDLRELYNNHRMSLAVISIHDFSLYEELYGFNFKRQLELAVGNSFLDAISSDFNASLYHLGEYIYVIVIKSANDKRLIDSKLNQFMDFSIKKLHKLNSRLNIKYDAGVYRLGKNINLEDPSLMLSYAFDALNDAKAMNIDGNHISHYDSEDMKNRFKENNLVTAISEAIDTNDLNLVYQQIVNIKSSKVYGYYVLINLDSSELYYDEIMNVVKRRGLESRVNQYSVNALFTELKMLYTKTKYIFPVFIEINPDLIDRGYYEYLKERPNFYKISPSYVTLVVKSAENNYLKLLRQAGYKICSMDILDIYRDNSDFFVYDYRTIGKIGSNEIKELCDKHNVKAIAGGVDEKDDLDLALNNNFEYIFGRFYKRTRTMKELLVKLFKVKNDK